MSEQSLTQGICQNLLLGLSRPLIPGLRVPRILCR